jgi:hypothetical protein
MKVIHFIRMSELLHIISKMVIYKNAIEKRFRNVLLYTYIFKKRVSGEEINEKWRYVCF